MFDLDHVFVTFAPGSGGNFITALMNRIVSGDISSLPINQNGSFHILDNGKREGKDSISFGSSPEENKLFTSDEQRAEHYIKLISEEYKEPKRIVTWSHDYTNLPLYKKYFPKCRTLAITVYTPEEKLMSMMMQVNKVVLTSEKDIAIPLSLWYRLKNRLKLLINKKIKQMYGDDEDFSFVFERRFEPEYADIVFYYSTLLLLQYASLTDALNLIKEPFGFAQVNTIPYKKIIKDNSDSILSFYDLTYNTKNSTKVYSETLNRPMSNDENAYLKYAFEYYHNMQDKFLLENPVQYFFNRKEKAMDAIRDLKLDIVSGLC